MKDGQKIPLGLETVAYLDLISMGWTAFEVPAELSDDIFPWLYDNIGEELDLWQDNDFVYAERYAEGDIAKPCIISIRRQLDATLFKLSWPACQPYREFD